MHSRCTMVLLFRSFWLILFAILTTSSAVHAQAHFVAGVASIRDYAMPDEGVYGVVYNYGYVTDTLTDNGGNKITQVQIGPPGGPFVPLNVKIDVKMYALSPAIIWVSHWKFLGARYGAYIAPSFSNSNISAGLSTVDGQGANPETGQFAVGDLFVQPVWLGWNRKHFDASAAYGFYAPVGKYNTQTINFPNGPQVITAASNIGLGYWTHQLQGNVTWYPSVMRGTAITNTLTIEFNGQQRDTGMTNGNFLSWNWGASHYLPLDKQFHYLVEVGVAGYSQWQITDSSGPDVANPNFHDQVHGIGAQVGLISTRKGMQLNFRYMYEYYAANRFQGSSYSLNFGYTLKKPKPATPPAAPPKS
jgi:hypothetical protein